MFSKASFFDICFFGIYLTFWIRHLRFSDARLKLDIWSQ